MLFSFQTLISRINLLAHKVVCNTKGTNGTRPETNKLPRQLTAQMLLVSAVSQASTSQAEQYSISHIDRITLVRAQTGLLSLCLGPGLPGLVLAFDVLLLLFALYPLGLGSGFNVLVQEVRING